MMELTPEFIKGFAAYLLYKQLFAVHKMNEIH